jgi:hypothetical protein
MTFRCGGQCGNGRRTECRTQLRVELIAYVAAERRMSERESLQARSIAALAAP